MDGIRSECTPYLICNKTLKDEFNMFQNIPLLSDNFTLGRGRNNSVIIPFLSISRNHCIFRKDNDNWIIEDNSSFGIQINGNRLGKGISKILSHEDVIILEPGEEFVYKFINPLEDFETPRKRIKREKPDTEEMFNNVKLKFEESQSYEIKQIEEKIQNAKHMQVASKIMKDKLQSDMNIKIQQLQNDFAVQIENLKGEKNEIENQKAVLTAERDAQLATVKEEMEGKISELMNQIEKHNETETELLNENNNLKERLLRERREFLAELNRETSSKQDMLDKLEAKMREQEETRLKEKEELEQMLRNETEQLRLAKEQELKQLETLKKQREAELEQELNNLRMNLEVQVQQAEQDKLKAEQMLIEHVEERKKLTDEEKIRVELLIQEKEEIRKKLEEAQLNADKSINELKTRVTERETELAALAADRIQKQAEQSSEVITSLQEQLEKVKSQLKSVETEKNSILESICSDSAKEGTSKEIALAEVGELMESELQCSICAELFVAATTLNCAHTFCKYCITMWKRKKRDCPICRCAITSECKSLVLDSFIEKMVQNLTEEMKRKRLELLKSREELESELARHHSVGTRRRSFSYDESEFSDSEYDEERGEEESFNETDSDDYHSYWPFSRRRDDGWSNSYSGSDQSDNDSIDTNTTNNTVSGNSTATTTSGESGNRNGSNVQNSANQRADGDDASRRRGTVRGISGAYYGGYGRCFSCGARGHWAPGCPFR